MIIRQARSTDLQALGSLFADGDIPHIAALPQFFQEPQGPARSSEYFSSLLADPMAVLFVAEHEEQLIGAVHAHLRRSPDIPLLKPRHFAYVETLVVSSDWRRRGIGKQLMERIEFWARDKGATEIELFVWDFNQTAIALYDQLAYRTISRRLWKTL